MRLAWFVRHGQSESNANRPTTHPAEPGLTERGRSEAVRVAEYIALRPDLIVTSPYLRARQTAAPTITRFSDVPTAEWPIEEFTYLAARRYANTRMADRLPHSHAYMDREDPHHKDEGDGESFAEFAARLNQTLDLLRSSEAGFLVGFTHGFFIRGLVWAVLSGGADASPAGFRAWKGVVRGLATPNGTLIKIALTDEGRMMLYGIDFAAGFPETEQKEDAP
jgi:broad specificity phosphatase PhoE